MNRYEVAVTQEKPFWVAVVQGLPGGAAESRSLALLEGEVRDLVSALTNVDDDTLELSWDFGAAFPDDVASVLRELRAARENLERSRDEYGRLQHDAVLGVRDQGVSMRDTVVLFDLSVRRISQIAS
ncbi:hypothetical protein HQQ82_11530 [Rathayibacter sp. VKM Ac-2856]|uniref:hypothetical protein n=1 Tax=unclassified Rathayibacter TaxID=2609250 RepID=UPI0015631888|nr:MULTISPECIES: hypothetical protein [unclassified Rathayibacter]NQX05522.1 hypothetical protein [Rathayibacter sp. VKM Ac-2858]NQX20603.1 hypothetical protein [Rathayibacter sp. VKM Ac-2856]